MSNLVFMLPFDVTLESWAEPLTRSLNLTMTRVDDWDLQLGFRLVGETGAIRLLKSWPDDGGTHPTYALFGTAVLREDRIGVVELYAECFDAVRSIDAHIDMARLIEPHETENMDSESKI